MADSQTSRPNRRTMATTVGHFGRATRRRVRRSKRSFNRSHRRVAAYAGGLSALRATHSARQPLLVVIGNHSSVMLFAYSTSRNPCAHRKRSLKP